MKVMVTGGTGFVGSHTVAELMENGHEVRLLVRSKERIGPALGPLGVQDVDAVMGDILDRDSVKLAAEGCDATIHCGSVYSLDSRVAETIRRTNVAGTETVLDVAHTLGHDPIIHVSSFVALMGTKGAVLTPDSAPTKPPGAYFRSKADSDLVARRFQENGAPVVIIYPGSVWGPHDPHLGESCQIAHNILKGLWRIGPKGQLPISDVRDIARLHVALMAKGLGPRRYMAPSRAVSPREIITTISAATERKLNTYPLPGWALLGPTRALDSLQRLLPFRLPYNFQAVYCVDLGHRSDDSTTRSDFGIEPRPLSETITDTVRWLAQQGHVAPRLIGSLSLE